MLGRDVNAPYKEYRTWLVDDEPDFDGYYYSGYKSGSSPLEDIIAYQISNSQLDFNLPNPLSFFNTLEKIPSITSSSQLAVVDGYVYLFGGVNSNKIYYASLSNPYYLIDTEATLPEAISNSQIAVIDGYCYMFGGRTNGSTSKIYVSNHNNPLVWNDTGYSLPIQLQDSSLILTDGYIYLFGGNTNGAITDVILRAPISTPLIWSDTESVLPQKLQLSQPAILNNNIYLFGGVNASGPTNNIYSCSLSNPLSWSISGTLPYPSYDSQFVCIGDKAYLFGSTFKPSTDAAIGLPNGVRILMCDRFDPLTWDDTTNVIHGDINASQLAIINDRIFLYGGNGLRAIFASNVFIKYNVSDNTVGYYRLTTRDNYIAATTVSQQFNVLGFPPWKTNYGV